MSIVTPQRRIESSLVRAGTLVALLIASTVLLSGSITDIPFHTKGEPREALVIQSMFEQHRYVLVLRNGDEIPSKPPLFHWLGTIAAHTQGGVTERATRLPSVLAGLALIAMTTLLGFRWWGTVAGIASGTALLSTQQFIASATTARVDMVLAACVSIAIASGGLALEDRRRLPLTFYVACAMAVLAKGPVGYVLPVAIVATYAFTSRRVPRISDLRISSALLISLIPVAWYCAAWWIGGQEFLDKLLLKENVYRVLDPDTVQAGHVKPFWYYGPALLGAGAPWSLCLPAVAVTAWRRRHSLDDDHVILPLIWIAITVALFSLAASKRPVYLLPCFPAVALLVGHWVTGSGSNRPLGRTMHYACLSITGIAASAIGLVALQALGISAIGTIAPMIGSESDRANLATLMDVAGSMRQTLLVWAAASLALLGAATHSILRRRRLPAFLAGAALVILSVPIAGLPMQREMAKRQSVQPFIDKVASDIPAGEAVYFYGLPDYSAAYYLHRPIPAVEDAHLSVGRNRTWYFVWERSVADLCARVRQLESGHERYRCRNQDRYDFFGNSKRDELVLVAVTPRRASKTSRSSNPR